MATVGYATLPIVPSFEGLQKAINRELQGLGALGTRAGGDIGDGVKSGIKSSGVDNALSQSLGDAEQAGQNAGDSVGSGLSDGLGGSAGEISDVVTGMVVSAGAAAGLLAGIAIASAISDGIERGQANDKLSAQLGLTPEESATVGRVSGQLYVNAFGESIPQINDSLAALFTNGILPKNAAEADIQNLGEKLLNFTSTFGQDAGEVSRTISTLLSTGMVSSADEAFDLLTKGFQDGNDKAGDLLDTFNEYPTQFRKLGLDGASAMGLINQGLQAGARDSDVVADALKEFSIRAVDGSELTAQGFQALGLDASAMAEQIAKGGPDAAAGLQTVLEKLRAIPDPVARSQAAVALFGTQAEDLGDALFALDPAQAVSGLGDMAGAATTAGDTLNDNLGTQLESIKRKLEPGSLLSAFQSGGIEGVKTQVSGAISEISSLWDAYGPQVKEALGTLIDAVKTWWDENGPTVMTKISDWWTNTGQPWLSDTLKTVMLAAWNAGIDAIKGWLSDPANLAKAFEGFGEVYNILLNPFNLFADWLTNTAGDWIKDKASTVWNGISDTFKNVLNILIDGWNALDFGIDVSVPDWVPGIGGRGFKVDDIIPDIPRLHSGGIVPGGAGDEMLALLQGGERVLSRSEIAGVTGSDASGFTIGTINVQGPDPVQTAAHTITKLRQQQFLMARR